MKPRISIKTLEPYAYKAMYALENYNKTSQIDPILKELIKIRSSQINQCAFCIDMHTEEALKLGESPRRIFALNAWRESHLFSESEKAALAVVEEVTLISESGLTDASYDSALSHFGDHGLAQIIMLIVTINAWNRIAVSTQLVYKK